MSKRQIVLVGTYHTKQDVLLFVKEEIEKRNCDAILLDVSPIVYDLVQRKESTFEADITPQEIAQSVGKDIAEIQFSEDRDMVNDVMRKGAIAKLKQLYSENRCHGVLGIGGSTMSMFATRVFQEVPYGVPKLVVCSGVRSDVAKWFGIADMAIMQVLVDLERFNTLVKNALVRSAGAICGMAEKVSGPEIQLSDKSIAMTEWGLGDNCAVHVSKRLEEKGYEIYPFHAQGTGDAAMESMINQGYFRGVIDIVSGGVIEEMFEGTRPAGPNRLEAAGERGLPQVIAPSGINMTNGGPARKHSEKYSKRERKIKLDEFRIITRYNTEELTIAAKVYAEKLNKAKGPVSFLFPLRGWSTAEKEGRPLYAPEEDRVFIEEFKKYANENIEVQELDCNLNDPEFADAIVETFLKMGSKREQT